MSDEINHMASAVLKLSEATTKLAELADQRIERDMARHEQQLQTHSEDLSTLSAQVVKFFSDNSAVSSKILMMVETVTNNFKQEQQRLQESLKDIVNTAKTNSEKITKVDSHDEKLRRINEQITELYNARNSVMLECAGIRNQQLEYKADTDKRILELTRDLDSHKQARANDAVMHLRDVTDLKASLDAEKKKNEEELSRKSKEYIKEIGDLNKTVETLSTRLASAEKLVNFATFFKGMCAAVAGVITLGGVIVGIIVAFK